MKKYYRVVGNRLAVFSMDADIPIERVCKIMKCKKVREISFEDFLMPRAMNLKYIEHKIRLLRKKKHPKLTRLVKRTQI